MIEYAELLLSTPEYWNIACNYLATAGDIGIGRMRAVLLHVGLRNPPSRPPAGNDDMVVDEEKDASRELDRVESVLRAAEEYRLEGATKEICRVSRITIDWRSLTILSDHVATYAKRQSIRSRRVFFRSRRRQAAVARDNGRHTGCIYHRGYVQRTPS